MHYKLVWCKVVHSPDPVTIQGLPSSVDGLPGIHVGAERLSVLHPEDPRAEAFFGAAGPQKVDEVNQAERTPSRSADDVRRETRVSVPVRRSVPLGTPEF
ncbi:hypothetical protein ACIGW8_06510 [Streptomyces sioyaensis]|uniref:hypothetical protein n=1 Tax=Streptomyces sioyaensis TaxID=67364 RepID=UPI0037CD299C